MRIVLDANVVVSALFGGTPREAVACALDEEVFVSPEIEAEFAGLKDRLREKISPQALRYWTESFLPSVLGRTVRVGTPPRLHLSRDPKDDAYLSLAKAVEADYLVTGDKDLLEVPRKALEKAGLFGLAVVDPRDFLKRCG